MHNTMTKGRSWEGKDYCTSFSYTYDARAYFYPDFLEASNSTLNRVSEEIMQALGIVAFFYFTHICVLYFYAYKTSVKFYLPLCVVHSCSASGLTFGNIIGD